MGTTVEIEDVGPIYVIKIPLKAGIVCLHGRQGTGKSTALKATSRALGGGGGRDLQPRDKKKKGFVAIGAAKMTITRSKKTSLGELEVESLEGRLDISKLIDPGIADPERADAARIKSLVSLRIDGNDAAPLFFAVAGGETAYRKLGVEDSDDPSVLCGRVKRALEGRARNAESRRDERHGILKGLASQVEGRELIEPEPANVLVERAADAAGELARAEGRAKNCADGQTAKEVAHAEIEAASRSYDGPTVEAATASLKEAMENVKGAASEWEAAGNVLVAVKADEKQATAALFAATEYEKVVAAWREQLNQETNPAPTDEELAALKASKSIAIAVVDEAAETRRFLEVKKQMESVKDECKLLTEDAEHYRDRAKSVEDVLTELLPAGPLKVVDGRLVVSTDRSDQEPMSELSFGERAKLVIDVVSDVLPDHGVAVLPQEFYEGLDPENRKLVHEHAKAKGVCVLTAEATNGELRVCNDPAA